MASANAKAAEVELVLAGRPQDEVKLVALAAEMGAEYRLFAVDDFPASEGALSDIAVLLNCAGPFMRTAEPLMQACLATGTHYLDIAAELDSYRLAERYDEDGQAAVTRRGQQAAKVYVDEPESWKGTRFQIPHPQELAVLEFG